MKLNFIVEIDKSDNMYDLQDELLNKASEQLIGNIMGCLWDKNNSYAILERKVIEKLESIMSADFKKDVSDKVTDNLVKKFEKSKQFKELQSNEEVVTDSVIKSGLKDLVAEIVRSEMKKVFK
jgi:predicted oxidoreductase